MTEEEHMIRAIPAAAEYRALVHIAEQLAAVLDSETRQHTHRTDEELTDEYCGAIADKLAAPLLEIMRPEAAGLADMIIGVVTLQTMLLAGRTLTLKYKPDRQLYSASTVDGEVCSARLVDLLAELPVPGVENKTDEKKEKAEGA